MKRMFFIFILGLTLISCNKKEVNVKNEEAEALFEASIALIFESIKNYSNATDSFTIDSLNRNFEKRITDINFSVPPETDLKLSEQENDSIYKLLRQMEEVKVNKLKELGRNPIDKDSIKGDNSTLNGSD